MLIKIMMKDPEKEEVSLSYNSRKWEIEGPLVMSKRIIWLMGQVQLLEQEFRKRNDESTAVIHKDIKV